MKVNFVDRVIVWTCATALLCLAIASIFHHFKEGLAVFTGSLWGILNIYFLKRAMHLILIEKKYYGKLLIIALLKGPLLYLLGFFLLKTHYFSSLFLLAGFSLTICMMLALSVKELLKSYGNRSL